MFHNMASEKREKRIRDVVEQRQAGLVVVLEDIHDPHNAEAIFRSCDAFGVQDVYLIFNKEKPFNPQKIGNQSSSSANKWLTFHVFRSTEECVHELKEAGYMLVATAMKGDSIFGSNLGERKLALLVGNEHSGLSDEALQMADLKITVPMRGMVESLNVSVASALFLFEITRQRSASGKKHALGKGEQATLVEDFMTRSSKRLKKG